MTRNSARSLLCVCGVASVLLACVSPPPFPKILRTDVSATDVDGDDAPVDRGIGDLAAPDTPDLAVSDGATDEQPEVEAADQGVADLRPGTCEQVSCGNGGRCEVVPADDGAHCDDGDPCTLGDACQAGLCTPGKPGYSERFFGGAEGESVLIADALLTEEGLLVAAGGKREAGGAQLRPLVLVEGADGGFAQWDPAPADKRGGYAHVAALAEGAIVVSGSEEPSSASQYGDEMAVQVLTKEGALAGRWDSSELLLESVQAGKLRVSPSGAILLAWRGRTLTNPLAPFLTVRLTRLSYTGFLSPASTSELFILGRAASSVDGLARGATGGYAAGGAFADPPGHWFAWLDEQGDVSCSVDLGQIDIAAIQADPSGDAVVLGTAPLGGSKPALYVGRFGTDCNAVGTWTTGESPFASPTGAVSLGEGRWGFVGYSATYEPTYSASAGAFWLDLNIPTAVVQNPHSFQGQAKGADWSVWGVYGAVRSSATHVIAFGLASNPTQNAGLGWLVEFAPLAEAGCWPTSPR
ncbi:MAG: hypothetical protein R3F39_00060 [Myxococcota bacterium]